MDDFKVSINVEKDLNVYATVTYIGEAAEKDIYHGGSIFFLMFINKMVISNIQVVWYYHY